ncbi:DUF2442 domain-containing protein [Stenomitos frigidus]|uniref:DUF2442 domain-containing protein n=1 Tax=Stenomitos frigidus ULC18 TaxID=2107698 RepID=A0A2T1EK11_9CYAN|nr:DUF2442 domain-containing protein [Stenomitos frigidus]PSB33100.1 DUF2442 domain-containing protein [Stenomitos frigidus ULC18]
MDSVELNEGLIAQIAQAKQNAASLGTRGSANASLTEPTAESAFYDRNSGRVVIQLRYGATFSFPAELGQGLAGASPDDLADVEVTPSGTGLHWEKLDADLSVPAWLNGIYGNAAWMAIHQ